MLKIGEFSRVSRVPTKTLRYYDEIGLFRPARVDTFTGYRLYGVAQLPLLNRILALKECGFSLEQIARLLDTVESAAIIREMLVAKRAELHARIAEEGERLARVEARLRQIEQEEHPMPMHEVVIKDVEPMTIAAAREVVGEIKDMSDRIGALFGAVSGAVGAHGWKAVGPPLTVYPDIEYTETNIDTIAAIPVDASTGAASLPPPDGTVSLHALPGGTVAALVYQGPYSGIGTAYIELGGWISANGYRMTGPPREMYLTEPDNPGGPVTELQYPVEKA